VADEHERLGLGVLAEQFLERGVVEAGAQEAVFAHAVGKTEGFGDEFGGLARAAERAVQNPIRPEAEAGERCALGLDEPRAFQGQRALVVRPAPRGPVGEAMAHQINVHSNKERKT